MPAGYTSGQVSLLDIITRTYKNAAGDVIATQTLSVFSGTVMTVNGAGMSLVTSDSLSTNRFKRTATWRLSTTLSPKTGASTTIATVVTSGKFDSRTESGGDITTVTYSGSSDVENDITVPITLLDGVLAVGDTV